jgi:hypothetical protein
MGKRILIITIILSCFINSFGAETAPIIDRPKNMDQPSKEESGILSTLVLIYSKTRNAVKFAYNEVMYFKEMKQNFTNMQAWFDRATKRAECVWDKSSEIFTNPKDIFVTLDRMQDIFDHIDYYTWAIPDELDHILAKTEITYDDIVSGGTHTAGMIPNTDEVIDYIDKKFGFNYLPSKDDSVNGKYVARLQDEKDKKGRRFPEEELVTASKLVAASSMSNAAMYKNWSINASIKSTQTESKFNNLKGANGNELAACWYAIEQSNANNKLLMNHLEDLKVLQATLGIYVYDISDLRTQELSFKNNFSDFSMSIDKALEKSSK